MQCRFVIIMVSTCGTIWLIHDLKLWTPNCDRDNKHATIFIPLVSIKKR